MSIAGAIIAGLVATMVMSMVMVMAPKMGMPKMEIWTMLGSMFQKNGNSLLGWVMHLMMGVVFAIMYAVLWSLGIGKATVAYGAVFGVAHWIVAGMVMGMVPMMHAGIKAGTVKAPGLYMMSDGGMMAFVGGLIGHVVFGITVALVYALFVV